MDMYKSDLPVMMPIPYTPRDDGRPLSANELRAFKTVGPLDRHLTAEEARIVELHFKSYVHQGRDSFQRFIDRSARFLPLIKQSFKARGIPEDIAYLCMVESGGNPNARSHAGAVGLWQFMPATGRAYGLRQNSWIDERRDPFKATRAASDYLLKLYNDFSNWHLAIAAYNAGEGKIGRAVSGTGAGNFFELCRLDGRLESRARLKRETREYVPRLLAMTKIMRNLKLLGFREPSPQMAWNLKPMKVPAGVNLAGLARHVGLTWDEFSGMNPAYRKTASPPNDQSTAYLPPAKMVAAINWVAGQESRIFAGLREYTIRKGDTMASLSRKFSVSESALGEANGFRSLPVSGSVILIPPKDKTVEPVYEALPQVATEPTASAGTYTVRQGDTLASLAQVWGTDLESLRLANRMGRKETSLQPGERISIPGNSKTPKARPKVQKPVKAEAAEKSAPAKEKAADRSGTHTIRKGDTVSSIAKQYGVSYSELCSANKLNPKKPTIKLGQKLQIPGGKAGAKDDDAGSYTFKKGDSLSQIAKRHKVSYSALCAANKLNPKKPAVRVGMKLTIPGKGGASAKSQADAKAERIEKSGKSSTYTVKAGETLHSVSRATGVDVDDIAKANKLSRNAKVKTGQKLLIPGGASTKQKDAAPVKADKADKKSAAAKKAEKEKEKQAAEQDKAKDKKAADKKEKGKGKKSDADKGPAKSGSKVSVKPGDTLFGIARANSVSVEALQKANNLGSSTRVKVGQKLTIP
ncbi:LysM peptidoglycan-binding domain-containing protein [Desulfovibrio sp. OttesenSCG-928-G15]|nr:LysM peptidoglycan-binding domain-containing protein [Desulfovibrio sp. OttesenSCG-928-G15]